MKKLLLFLFTITLIGCEQVPESKNEAKDKSFIVVTLKISKGNQQAVFDLLDSEMGLPITKAYDGFLSLETIYNPSSNTIVIVEEWETYEKYGDYLKWREEEDTSKALASLLDFLEGGIDGFTVYTDNKRYKSY